MFQRILKRPSTYFFICFIIAILFLNYSVPLLDYIRPIPYETFRSKSSGWILFLLNYAPALISIGILFFTDKKINDKNKILLISVEVTLNLLLTLFVIFFYFIQYSVANYWPTPS